MPRETSSKGGLTLNPFTGETYPAGYIPPLGFTEVPPKTKKDSTTGKEKLLQLFIENNEQIRKEEKERGKIEHYSEKYIDPNKMLLLKEQRGKYPIN